MSQENIYLRKSDYQQISALLENTDSAVADALWQELDRARVVDDSALPANTVAMQSQVVFVDLDSGEHMQVELVYPSQADIAAGRVSILAPVGAALIGLSVGQQIDWPLANGRHRRLQVVSVESPENGDD